MTGRNWRLNAVMTAAIGLFFLIAEVTLAQNVQFTASATKTRVSVGERLRVDFALNTNGDDFQPPSFTHFRVLSGPNPSTSVQFINGRSSYSITYSYILYAAEEAEFDLGSATMIVDGKKYSTEPIHFEIVKDASAGSNAQGSANDPGQAKVQSKSSDVDLGVFYRISASKSSPYVGEPIVLTLKVYYRYNIRHELENFPQFNGFWSEQIDLQRGQPRTEIVDGVRFNSEVMAQYLLIPQKAGKLTIDPVHFKVLLTKRVQSRNMSPLDEFLGRNLVQVEEKTQSNAMTIDVKELPTPKPSGFDGAVGRYELNFKSDISDLKTNDAVNISYRLSGNGNIKLLDQPKLNFPVDFEIYDPDVTDKVSVSGSGMSGERVYNYLCIPRHNGQFEVESPEFIYFDPIKEKYVTIPAKSLAFNVEKGSGAENNNAINFAGSNKQDIKYLGSDIRYIRTDTILLNIGYNFFASWLYYLLWLLPAPIFLLAWLIKRKVDEKMNDKVYMKRSRASRMAEKRLAKAKKLLKDGRDKEFYEEVFRALYGFFGDKFNLNTAEISKERIADVLQNSVDKEMVRATISILDQCEMARFAPTSDVDRENVYRESVELLSNIQKQLK